MSNNAALQIEIYDEQPEPVNELQLALLKLDSLNIKIKRLRSGAEECRKLLKESFDLVGEMHVTLSDKNK